MVYPFCPGQSLSNQVIESGPHQAVAGCAIGIVVLDLRYPLLPGNVANASTWDFPVMYRILAGTGVEILDADPTILEKVIQAGREMEYQGVRAIVGSCGYFGFYQREVAAALTVPAFMSSLLQAPMILASLKPDQKLGIICAVAKSLTPALLEACQINDQLRLVIAGAQDLPEFKNIIGCTGRLDNGRLKQEMIGLAEKLVADNPDVGAILLECSDMPPYASAIQRAVKKPVFDFTTLVNWIYGSVVRREFNGFI